MKLSLPANYDPQIVGELAQLSVTEVYGKLPGDLVGGGRPDYMAAPLARRELRTYIAELNKHGIAFNYLLNSACLGNEEWTGGFQRKLMRLLDWITESGARAVTVALPSIHRMIKTRYPELKTKIGIYAQVDTVQRARFWQDEGADAINLESFSINRDFATLRAIREQVHCDLVLIANHFCQPNCAYQVYHQVGHAHASGKNAKFLIDWPLVQCQHTRLQRPDRFIAAGWIRPEDIAHYENIGYTTFKLLERNIPSDQLLRRARAYHERRFSGNWAELLLSWGFDQPSPKFSWSFLLSKFKVWKAPLRSATQILSFLKSQAIFYTRPQAGVGSGMQAPIVIDSAAIPDDFLKHFMRAPACQNLDCTTCGYCARIARDAVRIDQNFLATVLPIYERLNRQLDSGELWGIQTAKQKTAP